MEQRFLLRYTLKKIKKTIKGFLYAVNFTKGNIKEKKYFNKVISILVVKSI